MAGNAVIGALRVVLGADSAALDKGLKDASSSLATFGAGVAKAGAAAAAAFVAAGAAIAVSVGHAIDQADKLGKMSQKIGVPVQELSALRLAAELSDVSMESLGKSVGKLSKAMVEAAAKPTSEAANAFRALGVSVTNSDGTLRSSSDVLGDIAGKFEGLKDGAGKTAVSIALFGKAGADMIPLLNTGKSALEEMRREAAKLGIVIDGETAKAAESFNDNLKRLALAKEGVIIKITAGLLPALENTGKALSVAANGFSGTDFIVRQLSTGLQGLVSGGLIVTSVFRALSQVMTTVIGTLGELLKGNFSAAWEKLQQGVGNVATTAGTTATALSKMWRGSAEEISVWAGEGGVGAGTKALKEFNYAALAGKTAIDQFLASQAKSQAAQQAELLTVGLAAGAKERLKVVLQGLAVEQASGIAMNEKQRVSLYATAAAAEQLALKLQGAQLIQQNLTPLQAYTLELNNSTAAMIAAGASQDQLARNAQNVADKFGLSAAAIGASIGNTAGSLSQLTATFAKENKSMGIASKAFGISQAIINTSVAVTKALATLPPPASYAAAAAAVAAGAAQIATISQQKFAMGGSFKIPGGVGGGDKVPVSFLAEPGEQVDISSNRAGGYRAADNGNGSRSSGDTTLVYIDAALRPLAEALFPHFNAAIRDGHELKLATV